MSFSFRVYKDCSSSFSRVPRCFAIVFLRCFDKEDAILKEFGTNVLNTLNNAKKYRNSVSVIDIFSSWIAPAVWLSLSILSGRII